MSQLLFLGSLQYVSLANIYSLTDQTMRAVATYTRNLVALDIRGCWRITDGGMNLVAEYCQALRVLNVLDCRDITECSLGKLRERKVRIDRSINPYLAGGVMAARRRNPIGLQV